MICKFAKHTFTQNDEHKWKFVWIIGDGFGRCYVSLTYIFVRHWRLREKCRSLSESGESWRTKLSSECYKWVEYDWLSIKCRCCLLPTDIFLIIGQVSLLRRGICAKLRLASVNCYFNALFLVDFKYYSIRIGHESTKYRCFSVLNDQCYFDKIYTRCFPPCLPSGRLGRITIKIVIWLILPVVICLFQD